MKNGAPRGGGRKQGRQMQILIGRGLRFALVSPFELDLEHWERVPVLLNISDRRSMTCHGTMTIHVHIA